MNWLGRKGYKERCAQVVGACQELRDGLVKMKGVSLIGRSGQLCIIAFRFERASCFAV